MSKSRRPTKPQRSNVLILDGGGVRGLSSLVILKELMRRINIYARNSGLLREVDDDLEPHDVFDLVAGTSTGGLIAIMLGKLGMSVEECIEEYYNLSKGIFKKKHTRGRISHGLAQSKFSQKRLRQSISDLMKRKKVDGSMRMTCCDVPACKDRMRCAVVCRELVSPSKYSRLKTAALPICNLPCDSDFPFAVCDAACATSAAPTFFPVVQLGNPVRCFLDGGMQHNNPSLAIQKHYGQESRVQKSRPSAVPRSSDRHGGLDYNRVRYVNIGTGTKTDAIRDRRRDILASFIPSTIRQSIFLKGTLTEIAVDSELTAESMGTLEITSHGDIIFDRFSAGNGVCYFKLDQYTKLDEIERLTKDYLQEEATQNELNNVAEAIVKEFLESVRPDAANTHPIPALIHTNLSRRQSSSTPQRLESNDSHGFGDSTTTPSSAGVSNDSSLNGKHRKHSTPLTEPDEKAVMPRKVRSDIDHVPTDTPSRKPQRM